MATAAKTFENPWEAKLSWSVWEHETLRETLEEPGEPNNEEAELEHRSRPGPGKPKRAKEVVTLTIPLCFVDFLRPGNDRIRFRVTRLKNGRFTFCDRRGQDSGTLGTTGLWGTLPPLPANGTRSLTPTAFKIEAARYVGNDRADEIVQQIKRSRFFSSQL